MRERTQSVVTEPGASWLGLPDTQRAKGPWEPAASLSAAPAPAEAARMAARI